MQEAGGTGSLGRLEPQLPAVPLDELAAEGEPQTGASDLGGASVLGAHKTPEQARLLTDRNAHPPIAYRKQRYMYYLVEIEPYTPARYFAEGNNHFALTSSAASYFVIGW